MRPTSFSAFGFLRKRYPRPPQTKTADHSDDEGSIGIRSTRNGPPMCVIRGEAIKEGRVAQTPAPPPGPQRPPRRSNREVHRRKSRTPPEEQEELYQGENGASSQRRRYRRIVRTLGGSLRRAKSARQKRAIIPAPRTTTYGARRHLPLPYRTATGRDYVCCAPVPR